MKIINNLPTFKYALLYDGEFKRSNFEGKMIIFYRGDWKYYNGHSPSCQLLFTKIYTCVVKTYYFKRKIAIKF